MINTDDPEELDQQWPSKNTGISGYGPGGTPAPPVVTSPSADPGPSAPAAPGPVDWIGDTLKSVQSTDDPNYWRNVIGQHGDTDNASARNYWIDRIRRGDGSSLVANGTLQKFQDGPAQGGGSDFQNSIRQMLMDRIKAGSQPIDQNSDEIRLPFEAASIDAQRGLASERQALAERLYASGGGSGTNELQQGIQQSSERMAGGLASLKGQLLQRAQQQRQSQLQQALQLAVQSGDAQSARDIQFQLAQMQLNQNQSQFNDSYGLQAANFNYLKDRDLASYGGGI